METENNCQEFVNAALESVAQELKDKADILKAKFEKAIKQPVESGVWATDYSTFYYDAADIIRSRINSHPLAEMQSDLDLALLNHKVMCDRVAELQAKLAERESVIGRQIELYDRTYAKLNEVTLQRDALGIKIGEMDAKLEAAEKLLDAFRNAENCPNCPNQGFNVYSYGGEPEQEQCQFCYENEKSVFNVMKAMQEVKDGQS